ncbi:MAG: glycosyltransferase family 4 protein [Patescibacteria group bacterium]
MRILILNWKDIKHPRSGGAEIVTHEIAKRLVVLGHQVFWFTSSFSDAAAQENIDGVNIYRKGNIYTVQLLAVYYYFRFFRKKTDIIIDQIHGIPFFTPLYANKPILVWIHEVAGEIWDLEFSRLVSTFGKLLEKLYFKFYRNINFLTVSLSTAHELVKYGLDKKLIHVIGLTIDRPDIIVGKKTQHPTLIYVGRIAPVKRLEMAIEAVAIITQIFPQLNLTIIGSGKKAYVNKLKELVTGKRLHKYITFKGKVTEPEKFRILSRSWINIHPSLKEGFGLTVLEAASCATPTACFRVAGLKDIVNNDTGVVIGHQSAETLAATLTQLIKDPHRLNKLSTTAYLWSKSLPTWKQQAKKFELLLQNLVKYSD